MAIPAIAPVETLSLVDTGGDVAVGDCDKVVSMLDDGSTGDSEVEPVAVLVANEGPEVVVGPDVAITRPN